MNPWKIGVFALKSSLIGLILLLFVPSYAQVTSKVDLKSVQYLVKSVNKKIPTKLYSEIAIPITLSIGGVNAENMDLREVDFCRWESRSRLVKSKKVKRTWDIRLSQQLYKYFENPQLLNQVSCTYGVMGRFIEALIIGELVKIYDNLGLEDKDKNLNGECLNNYRMDPEDKPSEECVYWSSRRKKISDSQQYLALSYFEPSFLNYASQLNKNKEKDLSLEDRQWLSPQQHLMASFESFLLNNKFYSEYPAVHQYFSEHFHLPLEHELKSFKVQFKEEVSIDFERVYGIYAVLVDPGQDMVSSYGHLDFLIVQCSPSREELSEECLQDTDQHIMVGYHYDDSSVKEEDKSFMAGINGKYDSILQFYQLNDKLMNHYMKENRSISIYQINLSDSEKKLFLKSAYERLNNYRSTWKHLSQNCVTQGSDLLAGLKKEYLPKGRPLESPTYYLERLIFEGFISPVKYRYKNFSF